MTQSDARRLDRRQQARLSLRARRVRTAWVGADAVKEVGAVDDDERRRAGM
jgi:hypothetical protein